LIVYGKQILLYILEKHPTLLKEVYLSKEIDKKIFNRLSKYAKIIKVDNKKAQALAQGGNHQGFIASIEDVPYLEESRIDEFSCVLVLAGLSDVGNIGAIIRSAYAYGIECVAVCGRRELDMTPLVRISSGAALDMPIVFSQDCASLLNRLKQLKFELICSKIGGKCFTEVGNKWALVMGSEDCGLPKKLETFCEKTVGIEMKNGFDSLNVSTATAILIDRIVYGRSVK